MLLLTSRIIETAIKNTVKLYCHHDKHLSVKISLEIKAHIVSHSPIILQKNNNKKSHVWMLLLTRFNCCSYMCVFLSKWKGFMTHLLIKEGFGVVIFFRQVHKDLIWYLQARRRRGGTNTADTTSQVGPTASRARALHWGPHESNFLFFFLSKNKR